MATPPRWWGRLAYCLGWVVAIVYASTPRTEGDYVFGRTTADYVMVYAAAPIVLIVGIVTTVLAARLRRDDGTAPDPPHPI